MTAVTDMTAEEMFESLTGYDEVAIAKAFSAEVTALADAKPTMFVRALVFTSLMRDGKAATDAKKAVMEMTLGQVNGYYADDVEVMADDPQSESGKDESVPARTQRSLPRSA
jgi:hypothetical protein